METTRLPFFLESNIRCSEKFETLSAWTSPCVAANQGLISTAILFNLYTNATLNIKGVLSKGKTIITLLKKFEHKPHELTLNDALSEIS
jgi:hypothetical protein